MEKSLLRFVTTGSVDDGKSTLIGRLLYETKSVFEDQLTAIDKLSKKRGQTKIDLSLLLDGLAAEREQNITIDVAYRYFETANRKFIIADCPGHEQYTRNMITGASTAQLVLLIIDAQHGPTIQSKRHGFLASLLRISHLVVAVNKMDLVGYNKDVFDSIVDDYNTFSQKLGIADIKYIPVSALVGDNVTTRSANTSWYHGPTLLEHLETVNIARQGSIAFRFPVQQVIRSENFRGYAGYVASGSTAVGEKVVIMPSGKITNIESIIAFEGNQNEALVGQSVVVTTTDNIDISRGDTIVRYNNLPMIGRELDVMLFWMDDTQLSSDRIYYFKHGTRVTKVHTCNILYRVDVNTLHREQADTLKLNEIGRVKLYITQPITFDSYESNRATGSFILIDELTNMTVAGGIIRGPINETKSLAKVQCSTNVTKQVGIAQNEYEKMNGHHAAVLWFTGYSGSGKSTIARILERKLFDTGYHVITLDGDNLRHGLCGNLGFLDQDRTENIRRAAEVANLFYEQGNIVICTFISPFEVDREFAKSLIDKNYFLEVYVKCSLTLCQSRDPRGLYKKALAREIGNFTGISSPYEEPKNPDIIADTELHNAEELAEVVIKRLKHLELSDG